MMTPLLGAFGKGRRLQALAAAVGAALGVLAWMGAAWAGPQGARVIRGDVKFNRTGDLTVITASNGSIINYSRFDILRQETVEFVQPSAAARCLNRILSSEPTFIDGTLRSNGIIYFVNPNGILFGRNSMVDVGGMYAAAGQITDQSFLRNVNQFVAANGSVTNYGLLRGGTLCLIGRQVGNYGSILADRGLVAMASGKDILVGKRDGHLFVQVEVSPADAAAPASGVGVHNAGSIQAPGGQAVLAAGDMFSMAVKQSGLIKARDVTVDGGPRGAVEVTGTLDASASQPGQKGGTVRVLGNEILLLGAHINASGEAGGGTVLVGGDFRGGGNVPTAAHTFVDSHTLIEADALSVGDGGKVIIWADDATYYFGALTARGGPLGGNGGLAEVSGHHYLVFDGAADLKASAGGLGSLFLDPDTNVDIDDFGGTSSNGTWSGGPPLSQWAPAGRPSKLDLVDLVTHLGSANVTVITTDALGTDPGNITLKMALNYAALANDSKLTLQARGDVDIQAGTGITPGAGTKKLSLDFQAGVGGGTGYVMINAAVDTNGGTVDMTATGGTVQLGESVTSGGGAQTYNSAVDLKATTTLSAGAGAIDFKGTVDSPATAYGLTANSTGATTFRGAVGGANALLSLTTNAGGTAVLNGGSVTTSGAQTYNDPVTLGVNTTLTGTALTLANTVNGGFTLTLNGSATTTLGGVVGGTTPPVSVTTDAAGTDRKNVV